MPLTAQNVVDDVRGQIKDEDVNAYRWTDAKLFRYMSMGQTEIVKLRPSANSVRANVTLTVDKTLQTGIVPATAIELIEVIRNMGADGNTPGQIITETSFELLDRSDRNWHTATASTVIDQWLKHPAEKTVFFVYPRAHAVTVVQVEILYSKNPVEITALADAIEIEEQWRQQLVWYVAGQALMEDEPHADMPRGTAFMSTFYRSLGVKPPR